MQYLFTLHTTNNSIDNISSYLESSEYHISVSVEENVPT